MSVPNVDTFEHDIAEEINTKEASLTDIASAGGDIGNITSSRAQTSNMLLLLGAFFIVGVLVITATFFYFYLKGSPADSGAQTKETTLPDPSSRLLAISPSINDALGGDVGTVTKSEYGYAIQVLSYPAVFSYMIKNEAVYADELSTAVGSPRDFSTTTIPFTFTDLTLNNQNMRVGTSGSSTLVYAFVNTNMLVVSSSTEGVLALRSSILTR